MTRIPFNIVMITVWCYWISVLVMILRSRLKLRSPAGAVPTTLLERWMWLLWVPTVIGWQVLPGLGYLTALPMLRAPQWAMDHPNSMLNWFAVIAAVASYVLTVPCWLTLGSNWSLAIVKGKKTSLITHGFYARVRHPIYALGLVLMAATLIVAPTPAMLLVGVSHLSLVLLKVANEERHLREKHGEAYLEYCRRTCRFIPLPAVG